MVSLALALILQTTAPAIELPPEPDFRTRFDYGDWIVKIVRGTAPPSEDASADYERGLNALVGSTDNPHTFHGFRSDSDADHSLTTGPWDPVQHADWNQSCEYVRIRLDDWKSATRKRFAMFMVPDAKNPPKSLYDWV